MVSKDIMLFRFPVLTVRFPIPLASWTGDLQRKASELLNVGEMELGDAPLGVKRGAVRPHC